MLHASALQDLGDCFKAVEKQLFTVQYATALKLLCQSSEACTLTAARSLQEGSHVSAAAPSGCGAVAESEHPVAPGSGAGASRGLAAFS